MEMNYRKIRPLDLDVLAKQYEHTPEDLQHEYNPFSVSKIQSFNPLYTEFFVLTESNYNRVGLNHRHYIEGGQIAGPNAESSDVLNYHVKCSPLLDPIHYLAGKYESYPASSLRNLPTIGDKDGSNECIPKIANKQNASYVDGFFCYLSSQIRHKHNMLNAVDFYGSYLAVQRVFKATITDDVDYLYQSPYFMDHLGKDYSVSCPNNGLGFDDFTGIGSRNNKKRLVFEEEIPTDELLADILIIDDHQSSEETPVLPEESPVLSQESDVLCEYETTKRVESESESESDDDDLNYSSSEEEDAEEKEPSNADKDDTSSQPSESESESSGSSETLTDSYDDEQEAYAYIKEFPTNLIFLEKCDGTLDKLFVSHEIDCDIGAACLMQVIMSLLALQKAFHFTHNDLHTNNVMYVNTDAKWLYYKYDNRFYRVPTYGRIFKIIDFGRAIYRFKDRIYCSDSFAPKGDAHSQYNTEPYFNDKRPRIEPNLSFDLCRLGTSIYDFVIQDEEDERDEFQETIYRWCLDDNGKNIMYRSDGEERYPGFKLYKMIAKNVHAHTPQEQLKYPFFQQFMMSPADAAKLDESEVRQWGLNIDLVTKEYV